MSPRHHPGDATLVSYAAGALSQVLAVVTAAHLNAVPSAVRDSGKPKRLAVY